MQRMLLLFVMCLSVYSGSALAAESNILIVPAGTAKSFERTLIIEQVSDMSKVADKLLFEGRRCDSCELIKFTLTKDALVTVDGQKINYSQLLNSSINLRNAAISLKYLSESKRVTHIFVSQNQG